MHTFFEGGGSLVCKYSFRRSVLSLNRPAATHRFDRQSPALSFIQLSDEIALAAIGHLHSNEEPKNPAHLLTTW